MKRRLIIVIKNLLSILLIGLLLGACSTIDDVRDPISVNEINWEYLSEGANYWRIENIKVHDNANEFDIYTKSKEFCYLMLKNPDKIYSEETKSSVKIYFRFEEVSRFSQVYKPVEYNGKESTFYVDRSLLPELEDIQNQYREN
ncbi:hypothetical protein NSQ43_01895 [Sporosarcina sp. FSL W8-0480]|uniref:hypothetical protein n=1 Tax=Sporosarcina sp. FSL W8-0480 TaxID=2954701 RepID=UPI0030DA6EDC